MRLAYLGTPEVAVPPLRALVEHGHDIAIVVTRADKRRGRGSALVPSPVKAAALELGLPVTTAIEDLIALQPELGVVTAFGRIIKAPVLAAVPMVNHHYSLLPRWRGAAPVERAILAGDERTGVCLMEVAEGLDTGGVYRRAELAIGPDETAGELRAALVGLAVPMLITALDEGLGAAEPQAGEATYAEKIDPSELEIDWSRPAVHIHRQVRVGGAWTTVHGKRLKVWRTSLEPRGGLAVPTGTGPLELVDIQPEGKGRMPARAWANGAHLRSGEPLPP